MKKVVYSSFAPDAKRFVVETTEYKCIDGSTVWVDANGIVYEMKYARLAKKYAAFPIMPLADGIAKGLYK